MFSILTVKFLSFRKYMPGQTVQTQIRLLQEKQSDQGAVPFAFVLTKYPKVWPLCLNFREITAKFSEVRKFRSFTVFLKLDKFFEQECFLCLLYELHHKETCLWGFRPGPTQTRLYNHRRGLEV